MALQVEAVYENGVLRPLQPLDLTEQEHVIVSVVKAASARGRSRLDAEYIDRINRSCPMPERPLVWRKSEGGLRRFLDRWPPKL